MPSSLECACCSYLLRGLDASGICPECSTPIAVSIGDRRDHFPSAERLRRARASLVIILACTLIAIIDSLFLTLFTIGSARLMSPVVIVLLISATIIGWLFWQMAWWGLAANDPTLPSSTHGRLENHFTPLLTLLSFGLLLILVAAYIAPVWRLAPSAVRRAWPIIFLLSFTAIPLLALAQIWMGAALLARIGRGPFARRLARFGLALGAVRWLSLLTALIWLSLTMSNFRSGRWAAFLSFSASSAMLWIATLATLAVFALAVRQSLCAVKRAISADIEGEDELTPRESGDGTQP